jgi:hypothetical protein
MPTTAVWGEVSLEPGDLHMSVLGWKPETAIFLMPGKGRKGTLEHLLFEAVAGKHEEVAKCVSSLEACAKSIAAWEENKKAKMRMQCVVASFCQDDPACSLGIEQAKAH